MGATIIYDLPFADYQAIDAVNATLLKTIALQSPRAASRRTERDTPAMALGRAVHMACFEPDRYQRETVAWTGGRRYGKAWDAFCGEHVGKTILKPAEMLRINTTAWAIQIHPMAAPLLLEGRPEVTIIWDHERLGVRIKARLDWLGPSAIVDLKSAASISEGPFCASAAGFGYHVQAALYSDATVAATGEVLPFKIIAAQTDEPFDVAVYDVPDDTQNRGRDLYEGAIETWLKCKAKHRWPGIAEDRELELRLPARYQGEPVADYSGVEEEIDDAA